MLVFAEGKEVEYPEKNRRSKDENQQQSQPTYEAEFRSRTRAKLVGGELSHHCAISGTLEGNNEREVENSILLIMLGSFIHAYDKYC